MLSFMRPGIVLVAAAAVLAACPSSQPVDPPDAGEPSVDAGLHPRPDAGHVDPAPADAGEPPDYPDALPFDPGPVTTCGDCPGRQACVNGACTDIGEGTCASPLDLNLAHGFFSGDLAAFDDILDAPDWCGLTGRDAIFRYRASVRGTLLVTTHLAQSEGDTILAAADYCPTDYDPPYLAMCADDVQPGTPGARLRLWTQPGWDTYFVVNARERTRVAVWARVLPFREYGEACSDDDDTVPFCALGLECNAAGACE